MAETLRGGLSLALSGCSRSGAHDIGGPSRACRIRRLYKRWVQFGLLGSHSRLHGEQQATACPWIYDSERYPGDGTRACSKVLREERASAKCT